MISKIKELMLEQESVVVFDIDGVLFPYEFGEYNHNFSPDSKWQEYLKSNRPYEHMRPLTSLQKWMIRKDNNKNLFVCSVASGKDEREQKKKAVMSNYPIQEDNFYFVDSKKEKLEALKKIQSLYPGLEDKKIIMVDDSIDVLTYIQENSNYSTAHISTFLQ